MTQFDWKSVAQSIMDELSLIGADQASTDYVALAIVQAYERGQESMRERAAQSLERDIDWTAFGKSEVQQWDGGPDKVRDYRLGIIAARAGAVVIRSLPIEQDSALKNQESDRG